MIDLSKQLNFTEALQENPQLRHFLYQACKKVQQQQSDHLRKIKKPELDDQLNNQFIVSGIPVLKPEKIQKFKDLFKNKLLGSRNIGQKNGLISLTIGMQNNIGNQTLYLTYKSSVQAKAAFNRINNLKFDSNHPMSCVWANQIRTLIEEQQQALGEFKIPTFTPSKRKVEHNLDDQSRSQFLFRQDKLVYLQWLDHLDKSAKSTLPTQYTQMGFAIQKMVFSSMGTYLAVCTTDGVHLYFGNTLEHKGFLRHRGANDAKFSPDQRFIITTNGYARKHRQNYIFWSLQQEIKLKSYRSHASQTLDSFQFSSNSQHIAIASQHQITFYTLKSVQQLIKQIKAPQEDQHIIKALYIQKMSWLKNNQEIIVMCYEVDYDPIKPCSTRVFIYNSEKRDQRKWRAWGQHAKNGQIHVSQKGQWVGIALRKFLKKGHFATVIQIGNLLKKEDPIQINTIELKQDVGNISWDSINNRIAVIYKDQTIKTINIRYNVAFYQLSTKHKSIQVSKLAQLNNNLQNRVVLANNGSFFALYNITQDSAQRGRFSLGLITKEMRQKGKRHINFEFTKQNLMVNGMNFFHVDQSGRFILLGTQKGYQVWNFIGQIITKDTLQKNIHDVHWRPRMMIRLPDNEEKKILEEQKQIRKKYQIIDDKRMNALKYMKEEAKQQRKKDFIQFIKQKQQWYQAFIPKRQLILGFNEVEARTDKYEVQENFIDLQ